MPDNERVLSVQNGSRIDSIDALRGFAVAAIFIVHSIEHFIFPVYPQNSPVWLSVMDNAVLNIVFSIFAGKAYAIFALLFGFTFYVQYSSRQRRGEDFGYRFLWRLALLSLFATVNAAFFPGGDVLLLFVVVGGVLFIVRKWSDKAVFITAVLFLLQPVEWFYYVMHSMNGAYSLPDWGVAGMYGVVAEYTKAGNFWDFVLGNITVGQKASLLWAFGAGRVWQTAGLFMLGMLLGRRGFFSPSPGNTRFWTTVLVVSAVVFAPMYKLYDMVAGSGDAVVTATMGTILDMWQKLAFTAVLVSSFMLLYNRPRFVRLTANLRYYGKMSLTNYVSQSILGALVYFPFGLYLAPYCGYTLSMFIGVALCALQILFCKWWLKSHKQGPLEHIWHRLTWIGSTPKTQVQK